MFHFTATAKYIWKMWEKNKCCWLWVISTSHQIPGALCFFVLFKTNEQLNFLTNCVLVLVLFKSTNLLLQLISHYCWSGVSVLVEKQRKQGDVSQDSGIIPLWAHRFPPTQANTQDAPLREEAGAYAGALCHRGALAFSTAPNTQLIALLPPLHPGQPFPTNGQPSTPQERSLPAWLTANSLLVHFSPAAQTPLFNNNNNKKKKKQPSDILQ